MVLIRYVCASLFIGLLLLPPAMSQGARGVVRGKIFDHNGEPLEGVDIIVTTPAMESFRRQATSKKNGRYSVVLIDATPTYEFRLEKEGFQTVTQSVKPKVGDTMNLDFTLVPAASETADVSPSADLPSGSPALEVFNEGADAFNAGDLQTARQKLEEAIKLAPDLLAARSGLARVYLQQGETEKAVAAAEKVLAEEPRDLDALRVAHDAYSKLGDREKANEMLQTLREVEKGTELAVVLYNEGADLVKNGDRQAAQAKFREAVELDPSFTEALYALALVSLQLGDHETAARASERLLQLDPTHEKGIRIRYDAYVALGNREKVAEALEALAAVDPRFGADALHQEATDLFNAGNMGQAKVLLEKVVASHPQHARSHYMLGLCYANTGDNARAKQHLERFVELAPDDPDAASAREMIRYLE